MRGDPVVEESWHLRPYQRGEQRFYIEHVRRAVEMVATDPTALLVFSGGFAHAEAGPLSEAEGYRMLAEHYHWWGGESARPRSTTEEFALDSFQNVLFSICRFREFTGSYPRRITLAGWGFKARRFTELHRRAIRFNSACFDYAAVNDPSDLAAAEEQEAITRAAFLADPYGCFGVLAAKRSERDSTRRRHGYAASCPELAELLRHRGPELFALPLPWD